MFDISLVDTEGPIVYCPHDVFGLTNDSDTPASIWWLAKGNEVTVTCSDDAEGVAVVSGDLFKVGTTLVTCTAWDAAGNPGQCTFLVTVTGLYKKSKTNVHCSLLYKKNQEALFFVVGKFKIFILRFHHFICI